MPQFNKSSWQADNEMSHQARERNVEDNKIDLHISVKEGHTCLIPLTKHSGEGETMSASQKSRSYHGLAKRKGGIGGDWMTAMTDSCHVYQHTGMTLN